MKKKVIVLLSKNSTIPVTFVSLLVRIRESLLYINVKIIDSLMELLINRTEGENNWTIIKQIKIQTDKPNVFHKVILQAFKEKKC